MESRFQFLELFEQAPAAMSVLTGSRHIVSWANRKQLELWQKSGADVLGKPLSSSLPESASAGLEPHLAGAYSTRAAQAARQVPARVFRDGAWRQAWFDTTCQPLCDAAGGAEDILVTSVEVAAPAAPPQAPSGEGGLLSLYEKVIRNINDAVLITEAEPVDMPGPRILFVNEAFTRMTGYTADDVLGKTPRILQGPKTCRAQLDKIRAALGAWQPVRVELTNYRKDGSEFEVEFDIVPVADETGWYTHWVSVQRDVSHRKTAEASLHRSEEKLRHIFNNTTTSIWVEDFSGLKRETERLKAAGVTDFAAYLRDYPDSTGTFMDGMLWKDVNEQTLRLFGARSKQEFLANVPGLFLPESLDFFPREVQAVADGLPYYEDETVLLDVSGTKRIHVLFSINFPVGTDYSQVLVNVTDITHQKATEAALQLRNQRLGLLARISQRLILGDADEKTLLREILAEVGQTLGAELFFHYLPDADARTLHLQASGGLTDEEASFFDNLPFGGQLCGRVAQGRRQIVAEDLAATAPEGADALRGAGVQAYAGFPLLAGGRLIGTVAFATRRRMHFAEGEVELIGAVCDQIAAVMERSRLTRELERSQDRLARAVDMADMYTWEIDLESGGMAWSENAARVLGFPPALMPRSMAEADRFTHPAADARLRAGLQELADGKVPAFTMEARFRHPLDGSLIWLCLQAVGEDVREGRPMRVLGLSQNITGRKATEETLRLIAERAELAQDAARASLYEYFPHTGRVVRSAAFTSVAGYGPDALDGDEEGFRNLMHPDDVQAAWAAVSRGIENGKGFALEYRLRHTEGHYIWVADRARVLQHPDGRAERVVGMILDITGRKKAEKALLEQQRFTQNILEAAPTLTYIFDLATNTNAFISEQTVDVLGYTAQEVKDMGSELLPRLLHPDDAAVAGTRFEQLAADATGATFGAEYRMRHKDGRYIWLLDRTRVFSRDAAGTPTQLLGVATDITLRRQAEEKQTFLLQLSDALKTLADPQQIQYEAACILGRHLGANRAGYAEDCGDGKHIAVTRDYTDGVPGLEGTYSYHDYGADLLDKLRQGQPVLRPDVPNDPTLTPAEKEAHRKLALGATLNVPLVKDARLIAVFFVHFKAVHPFSDMDMALVLETAERTWAAVERARTQAALQQSEASLRKVKEQLELSISAGRIGLWHWDAQADTLAWSKEQQALYGLADGEFEGTLDGFLRLLHPDEAEFWAKREKEQHASADADSAYTFRIIRKDGAVRWIQAHERRISDAEGRLLYVSGINTDITEQIAAQEELRERESRFRTLTQALPQVVWTADPAGEVDFVNDLWYNYTGGTPHTTLGRGWTAYVHPDDAELLTRQWAGALQTGLGIGTEFRVRGAGGGYKWFTGVVKPVFNTGGEVVKWIGTLADSDERKKAELMVRESEERFRNMAEQSPMWVWMTDREANITYANPEMLRYFGLQHAEAFTGRVWDGMAHPDDTGRVHAVFGEAVRTKTGFSVESRGLNAATGQFEWCLYKGVPRFENNELVGFMGTGLHIHRQKEVNEALEKLVRERTGELEVVNQELLRSNADLQQFAHVASHDLKEPVRKVMMFVSCIRNEFEAVLPDKVRQYIAKIEGAARRSSDMIDGVLHYSSLNSAGQQREAVNLDAVLQNILADLEVPISRKAAVIHADTLPVVEGYAGLLHQLLYNLLLNALKFTRPGVAPVIEVRRQAVRHTDGQGAAASYLRLSVADNGIGFPQKDAEHIFQTFTRLHAKDQYEGSGMGLALCRKIAERHGGFIQAEGEENRGATFTVFLPTDHD